MDEIAEYNRARWNDLVAANIAYGQAWLDMDAEGARQWLNGRYVDGDLNGKDMLCLANGGGQQSVAFNLLGANVTVIDMSEAQLEQDKIAAEHYGFKTRIEQGDMRDLSRFEADSFDVVWHAYSINFVPDATRVLQEMTRVIRDGGLYYLQFYNPYYAGMDEADWNGEGYVLKQPYLDNTELVFEDMHWDVEGEKVDGPREFRHALSTLVNTLIQSGFAIRGLWEDTEGLVGDLDAEGGSWEHFVAVAPSYMVIVATLDLLAAKKSEWIVGKK